MADWNDKNIKLADYVFFLILLSHMLITFVDGRGVDQFMKDRELPTHEGTVKTIESEDGDVVDCVDIRKQPAFNHPLLKNHTVEIKPHVHSSGTDEAKNNPNILFQSWHKNGECPEGTVPLLRRTRHFNRNRRSYPAILRKKVAQLNDFINSSNHVVNSSNHEYVQVSAVNGNYYGARATINVWNPVTNLGELSIAQIWVLSGKGNEVNTVEAGWMVSNGEKTTRLFIYWTSDGYQRTGCYNLDCPGFVQTNKDIALGGPLEPVSTYGGEQHEIRVVIQKNKTDGNWWLQVQDQFVGYWPSSIFTHLAGTSDAINWGGEIVNNKPDGHHTSTQMGSGHFPNEGPGKASFFANLGYFDEANNVKDPENLVPSVTRSACYDFHSGRTDNKTGVSFYFGGPGYSKDCQ